MAPDRFETDAGRDYVRVALVVCCLLAVVLAGTLVPVIASTGLGDTPLASAIPGDELDVESGDRSQSGTDGTAGENSSAGSTGTAEETGGTGQGGLGALNPGDRTDVGGEIGTSDSPYRSQDATPHFTVRSSQPAYWRTGSYGVYVGSGWAQEGEPTPYDGSLPQPGIEGDRVSYEVSLNRPATALPTVWRPDTVTGVDGLLVTERRALQSREGLMAGASFSGVSHRASRSPDVLRAAGTDYPTEIERRYTRLPDDTPDRLGRFTTRLTADETTPYGTARRIERWLESNKEYSLNASRTSNGIADTFVFEMERGYCEYFATSMVVMLRSQGIPARYTVGYSTGQQVGENTYRVRGMNAHAWVEVYFEDVGWVTFDPTPGSARLQQEQQSMRQQHPDEPYAPEEQGSPAEQFSPNESRSAGDSDEEAEPRDEPTTNRTAEGYDVALNRTAVPGASVTVTITRGDEPVAGQAVLFNSDPIGVTGSDGQVTGTVPYAEQLRITLQETAAGGTASRERFFAAGAASAPANVTYPVETNASVSVTGDVRPGATVTVTATVDDVPVRDGAVTVVVDGREADNARTGSDGRASVTLPRDSGPVTVRIERGPVSGERTVTVPALSVAADPRLPVALPLTGAEVTVRAGERPVSDAPVLVDGRQVATTGVNGTATVSLPLADGTTIGATSRGLAAQTTVSGLFVNLLFVLVALGGAIGVGLYGASRYDVDVRAALVWLARLPALAARYGQLALVSLATRGDELLERAIAALRTAPSLRALASDVSLAALWASVVARLRDRRSASSATAGARREPDPSQQPGDTDGAEPEPRLTVREAWTQLLRQVSVRRPRTKTPGELAEHAVESDGLPAEPVVTLRDTFREVEYGSRSASERVERVQQAVEHIEQARADERADGTGTGTSGGGD